MRPSDSPSNDLQITFCSMPASEVLQKKYAKLAISNVQTSIVNCKSQVQREVAGWLQGAQGNSVEQIVLLKRKTWVCVYWIALSLLPVSQRTLEWCKMPTATPTELETPVPDSFSRLDATRTPCHAKGEGLLDAFQQVQPGDVFAPRIQ